jgi:hypothetical protein
MGSLGRGGAHPPAIAKPHAGRHTPVSICRSVSYIEHGVGDSEVTARHHNPSWLTVRLASRSCAILGAICAQFCRTFVTAREVPQ